MKVLALRVSGLLSVLIIVTTLHARGPANSATLFNELSEVQNLMPDLVSLDILSPTPGEKDVLLMTFGTKKTNPALLIVGGIDGSDYTSTEICLQICRNLVTGFRTDDSIKQLLTRKTIYIIPRANPDAFATFFQSPQYESEWNLKPLDDDLDGLVDEDGYQDLNGDGMITHMLVEDLAGDWILDPEWPDLIRKADIEKGEAGLYRLELEGLDADQDGKLNEDPPGGIAFDQDFPFLHELFAPHTAKVSPSQPETKALVDFVFSHENIFMVYTFSKHHNAITPWKVDIKGEKSKARNIVTVPFEDAASYTFFSNRFKKTFDPPELSPVWGGGAFSEWAYFHAGRFSVAVPAWWPTQNGEQDSTIKVPEALAPAKKLYDWIQANDPSRFVAWQDVDHPDFPDQQVKVGGFAAFAENAPQDSISALANNHSSLIVEYLQAFPEIEFSPPTVVKLEKNLYRISTKVKNRSVLPTISTFGKKMKWVRKIKVELDMEKDQLLSGTRTTLIDRIEGHKASKELSWVIRGKAKQAVVLKATGAQLGTISTTIVLP